jgi:hypothetical protein
MAKYGKNECYEPEGEEVPIAGTDSYHYPPESSNPKSSLPDRKAPQTIGSGIGRMSRHGRTS